MNDVVTPNSYPSKISPPIVIAAGVYIRVSTHEQGKKEKFSIPEQESWAKLLCEERGWLFVRAFVDECREDVLFTDRPGASELLANLGNLDLVLFYHSDRASRDIADTPAIIKLLTQRKVQVYFKDMPNEPVAREEFSGLGLNQKLQYVMGAFGAESENRRLSEKVTFSAKGNATRGVMKNAPFWFKKIKEIKNEKVTWHYEYIPDRKILVMRICELYDKGKSQRGICKLLIGEGIPSPAGAIGEGSWSPATIKNILTNPALTGWVRWGRKLGSKYRERKENGIQKRVIAPESQWTQEKMTNAPSEGIISEQMFRRIQERLRQRGQLKGLQHTTIQILSGLVYCEDCGRRAFFKTRKTKEGYTRTDIIDSSYVRMLNCRRHLITAKKLEHLVLVQIQKRLHQLKEDDLKEKLEQENEVKANMILNTIDNIDKQLKSIEAQDAKLFDSALLESFGSTMIEKKKAELDISRTILKDERIKMVAILENPARRKRTLEVLRDLMEMFLKESDPQVKREMIQRIIEKILVGRDSVALIYRVDNEAICPYGNPQQQDSTLGLNGLIGKPCPCGFFGDETRNCTCSPGAITRYQKRISGPILDRIDMHITVPLSGVSKLTEKYQSESSRLIQKRVQQAREKQLKRFKGLKITSNAEMNNKQLKQFCDLDQQSILLMKQAITKLNLSARAFHRVVKIARTIADLEGSDHIKSNHIAEALQYRPQEAIGFSI